MPRKPNTNNEHYYDPFPTMLRALIKENGTKQEELKDVLGVKNRQSVTGYIDGSTVPTIDKVIAIAKYYGVNADDLLGSAKASRAPVFCARFKKLRGEVTQEQFAKKNRRFASYCWPV